MYKTYVFFLVASVMAISCNNSKKKDTAAVSSTSKEQTPHEKLLKQALELSDYNTAVVAINQILIEDTTRTDLYDSLAKYYIAMQNAEGSRKMVAKALRINRNNYKMLEYSAAFDQYDYKFPEAIEKFNTCLKATGDAKYEYLLATTYAQMQQLDKADSIINHLISLPADKTAALDEAPTPQNGVQKVKLLAKAYVMKAKLTSNTNKALQAKYINAALQVQPDYQEALYIKEQYKF